LITITGGKWTTYRLMAEQVIDRAVEVAGLPAVACPTQTLKLHGCPSGPASDAYGTDAPLLAALPGHDQLLHPNLPYSEAMVRFAIRHEAARTIEDILARRTRALFLEAAAAEATIERVAGIFAEELQPSPERLKAMVEVARESASHFSLTAKPGGLSA
jgi:glycerol-3-phosphate dehydrogenase